MISLPARSLLSLACIPTLVLTGYACSQSATRGPNGPDTAQRNLQIVHEPCDVSGESASRIDANNDGRADIVHVTEQGRERCRAVDLNFDGSIDSYLYFDDAGKLRRRESDFDRDGVMDELALYKDGEIVEKHRETNLDNKLDTWDTYVSGQLTARERDTNGDGRVDQWWSFPVPDKPECPVVMTDQDGDGRPDATQDVCKENDQAQTAVASHAPTEADAAAAPEASTPPHADAGADAMREAGSAEMDGGAS